MRTMVMRTDVNNIFVKFLGVLAFCIVAVFATGCAEDHKVESAEDAWSPSEQFSDPDFSEDAQEFVRDNAYYSPTYNDLKHAEAKTRKTPEVTEKPSDSGQFWRDFFEGLLDLNNIFVPILFVVFIGFLVFAMYRYFATEKTSHVLNEEKELIISSTIYDHDFLRELQMLTQSKRYAEAIRVVYLAALHGMNERKIVVWDDCKTPTDYYYEISNPKVRTPFFSLAYIFLQARFDDVVSDETMLQQAKDYHNEISRLTANKLML